MKYGSKGGMDGGPMPVMMPVLGREETWSGERVGVVDMGFAGR